jgi:pimeloyl-ACP methyl ester carboxylesterase
MEMFNDLRSSPDIRRHYQFWFYLYPTGQPFWISAAQLRHDLAEMRAVLDPEHREPALDQMVLVGHSMGGLVAKLQTIDSGTAFWNLASHIPLEQVRADPAVRRKLEDVFFFQPNPSIRRVVTIATPHHGSSFFNQTTQYLLDKMILLPAELASFQQKLFLENRDLLFDRSLLKIDTSIDSLAVGAPIFDVMLSRQRPPWVQYHNIIGELPASSWLHSMRPHSDGVVEMQSAHVGDVESELVVPAGHLTVHCHPAAVMEVRRILLSHLAELRGQPSLGLHLQPPEQPAPLMR